MVTICLDYDGSYNRFPELFEVIIDKCFEKGYNVIMATMRYPHEADEVLQKLEKRITVYYTCRRAKGKSLAEFHGVYPDLWIDDKPHFIFQDG